MSAVWVVLALTAFANPAAWSYVFTRLSHGSRGLFLAGWLSGSAWQIGSSAWFRQWDMLAGSAASLLLCAAVWWWNRRRRKRAPRAYGAKSRARVAALARKAREAAKPRLALRPVPGGAS
jgi:type VI protein secretion system component VasK